MKKSAFLLGVLTISAASLAMGLAAKKAWAACPTGFVEMYVQGSDEPKCLSESEFRSQQLRQQQTREHLKNLSQQRSLRDRQNATRRAQERLIVPR